MTCLNALRMCYHECVIGARERKQGKQTSKTMIPVKTNGAASWTELITSDVDGAIEFYKAVFGWQVEVMPMSTGPYAVGNVGGMPSAGMMNRPEEDIPPFWGVYFTAQDVDGTVERAVELGGQVIVPAFDVPEVGRLAVLLDPQGALFSVMADSDPYQDAMQREWSEHFALNGTFSWYELRVPDAAAAAAFYRDLFGWTIDLQEMSVGPYHVFQLEGEGQGGILGVAPDEMPPHWGCYITVHDLEACNQAITDHGGTIMAGSIEVPGVGTFTMFADPQGAHAAAIQYATPEEGA